ncbi:hypothetical protein GH733_001384 [Mirounga leonina]|nr:hypothetical protein GH733_001384 [Mirounga leonina]
MLHPCPLSLFQALPSFSILQISITAQKRSCNTATCVTHRLAGLLSRSGAVVKNNFVPTNVTMKLNSPLLLISVDNTCKPSQVYGGKATGKGLEDR